MTTTRIPLIARAESLHPQRTAIIDPDGAYTYAQLLEASARVASALLDKEGDLNQRPVAFLAPAGFHYVATQWGIWRAGGIATPLCTLHPAPELEYVITDTDAAAIVAHPDFADRLRPIAQKHQRRFLLTPDALAAEPGPLPNIAADRAAMIIYTSGTTSRPKGVVSTHQIIAAQIQSLIEAWEWTEKDRIPLLLPLHHLHGVINVLACALWAGAACEMMPRFDADETWRRLMEGDWTLFMAVPTIYARLVKAWEAAPADRQAAMTAACGKLRLMVCGSAALPVSMLEQWRTISGHTLLERYGMTEIGMGLSNPLNGPRVPGHVGTPLPGVEARLVDQNHQPIADGAPGEIQVRGSAIFREYWNRPKATADAFVDGWFRTGDVAVRENGIFRILGRNSVDIIKTGGFKVSALEIEEVLRTHDAIDQCAVVGTSDPEWGQRVAAAVVCKEGCSLQLNDLRPWAKERLAVYKVPSRLLVVEQLPRNAMGKVVKPKIVELFDAEVQAAASVTAS